MNHTVMECCRENFEQRKSDNPSKMYLWTSIFFFFSFHFWFITFTQHFSWNAMLRFWNGHIFCLSFVQSMFWCVFWFEMSLRWKYHVVLSNGSTLFRAGMNDFFWWNASNCKIIKFMLIRTFDHAIWSTSSSGGSIFMW